jgi:hypothetical protein
MLTSHSSLTRKDLGPEELWRERFHFTEEEFIMIQDARFERKPYFTIWDIVEDPFAGGVSAFAAITDNYFIPFMKGVGVDSERNRISVNTLVVNSLGIVECWQMSFKCKKDLKRSTKLMASPKGALEKKSGKELEKAIGRMLQDDQLRRRFEIFFNNEYYPALIPVRDKVVLLHRAVDGLIERGALSEQDREIVDVTQELAFDWFIDSE